MFERFRPKKDQPAPPDSKLNSQLPRGMEVVEESDPETGWGMWDEATAAQELRQRSGEPLSAGGAQPAGGAGDDRLDGGSVRREEGNQ